jgi:hypothetical protein
MVALMSFVWFLVSIFLLIASPIAFCVGCRTLGKPKPDYQLVFVGVVGTISGFFVFLWNCQWVVP